MYVIRTSSWIILSTGIRVQEVEFPIGNEPPLLSESPCVGDQSVSERYDVISRVFRLKLKAMMADFKKGVLGKCAAEIMCVEWQKRGLPHAHIMLFFAPGDKLTTTEQYDTVVCAEIPDPATEPVLHERVLRFMIHGPCNRAAALRLSIV